MAVTINGTTGIETNTDTGKVKVGASDDIEIYHNGTDSFIKNTTGDFKIFAGNDEQSIIAKPNGAIELYYDDSKKLETTGDSGGGIKVFNDILIPDNGVIRLGDASGGDLKIYHNGSHSYIADAGTGNLALGASILAVHNPAFTETMALFSENGAVELYYNNGAKLWTQSDGVTVGNADNGTAELRILGGASDRSAVLTLTADAGSDHEDNFRVAATADHYWQVMNKTSGNWTTRFRMTHTGTLTATDTSIGSLSDSRLKKNTADFTYDLTKFKQFKPKTYEWINTSKGEHQTGTKRGFLAQDIETVDPTYILDYKLESPEEIALVESDGIAKAATLGTNDAMYISVIQQLITKIETLETKVAALEAHTHE